MKNENPWIIRTDEGIRDFIVDLQEGEFIVTPFGETLKHIELVLDNLFLLDEELEKEVLDSLKASLKEKRMRFDSEEKMPCFFVSLLFQMIMRADMLGDVIYIREEIHPVEWEEDNNNNQNQKNNGKDSSENQAHL
jgi:hypothetical protein